MRLVTVAAVIVMASAWPSPAVAERRQGSTPGVPPPGQAQGDHQHHEASADPGQSDQDHPADTQPAMLYALPPNVPPLTEKDRAAAFPEVGDVETLDDAVNYFVLVDQLEWLSGGDETGGSWDAKGWIGGDRSRFWFRTEGEGEGDRLEGTQTHLLFGRAIARWWDVVVGVRQDVRPGPAQTWAAVGLQGLAPYWFELETTAYVGGSGRTQVRLETEYELLVTNRLILQPLVELEIYGKSDPERGIGGGLSTADAGLRLRYEIRREFAPYIGVTWNRRFFGTADAARAAGQSTSAARVTFGVRAWR